MAEENKNKIQDEQLNESQLDKVNGGLSGDGPSEEQLKELQEQLEELKQLPIEKSPTEQETELQEL